MKVMKISCCLACTFFLSSCVYYGVQGNFDIGRDNTKTACHTGSIKEKEQCRAELKKLNESIKPRAKNP